MRLSGFWLAAFVLVASTSATQACEMAAEGSISPLQTRKPVVGKDVRLAAGFGVRMHPLLQLPRFHTGVDWAAPTGTQVIAASGGKVVAAEPKGEYGNAVMIDHGAGWQALYAQLSRFDVKQGDCVLFGAPIGKVGTTGLSTGPHLHYEVRLDGKPVDPMQIAVKGAMPEADDKK
jgi:murein DD-endopeptidase MepM/ murein hydrolase activator NlpD